VSRVPSPIDLSHKLLGANDVIEKNILPLDLPLGEDAPAFDRAQNKTKIF